MKLRQLSAPDWTTDLDRISASACETKDGHVLTISGGI
jgi:hypothetical protein